MYRIIIKRDGTNAITGKATYVSVGYFIIDKYAEPVTKAIFGRAMFKRFYILSKKPYRAGCYINPAKVLRESGFIF